MSAARALDNGPLWSCRVGERVFVCAPDTPTAEHVLGSAAVRGLRVQPLMFSVTMPRKFQKPGSQRSHFWPPTPGLQEHWPLVGSHVSL